MYLLSTSERGLYYVTSCRDLYAVRSDQYRIGKSTSCLNLQFQLCGKPFVIVIEKRNERLG